MSRTGTAATAAAVLMASVCLLTMPSPVGAAPTGGVDDRVHVWEVVQLVRARPPKGPVVYYLGDSTARESTVTDAGWTAQLRRRAAAAGKRARVRAYTLGAHNQTFGMDVRLVRALPRRGEGRPRPIVLIGVSLSRFIGPPKPGRPAATRAGGRLSDWRQHHYDEQSILSNTRKHELAARWMKRRWDGFKASRTANLAALARLISVCETRGFRPMLVELPLNLAVVGHRLDRARASYRRGCRSLAETNGVEYLHPQRALRLPSRAFYDICHLVRRGYVRWQSRLSTELVRMLPRAQ